MSKLSDAFVLSQQVAILAKEEASRWGHPHIDVDHLFLALVVYGGPAGEVLRDLGVTLEQARAAVETVHHDQVASLGVTPPPVEARPIVHPMIGDIDWSHRALGIMRGAAASSSDLAILRALVVEPSGLVQAVLNRLGMDSAQVQQAIEHRTIGPASQPDPAPAESRWMSVTHVGYIPAPAEQVWRLVSDPMRRPGWDTLIERVEALGADRWDMWSAHVRPDGKATTIHDDFRRARLRRIAAEPPTWVEWEVTRPDRSRAVRPLRLGTELLAAGEGTTVRLTTRWQRAVSWRGMIQAVLAPMHRVLMRQQLISQAAAISALPIRGCSAAGLALRCWGLVGASVTGGVEVFRR